MNRVYMIEESKWSQLSWYNSDRNRVQLVNKIERTSYTYTIDE